MDDLRNIKYKDTLDMETNKQRLSFDNTLLSSVLSRDNATSIETYNNLSRESIINYTCKCGKSFSKKFNFIVKGGGAFCNDCSKIITNEKKIKTFREKYGVDNPLQNSDIKHKIEKTNLERYGSTSTLKNSTILEKIKKTNLMKYGQDNVFKSQIIKDKIKKHHLQKYGVNHHWKNNKIRDKIKQTLIKNYGVDNCSKNKDVIEKIKATNINKYGVSCSLNNLDVHTKTIKTCNEKYGVDYPLQSPDILEKAQLTGLRYKTYVMPSGNIRKVQGFEPYVLNELIKIYSESEIKTDKKDVPRIKYEIKSKSHYYFPDIYIPKDNKIIEVKSEWILKKQGDVVNIKKDQCISDGYNYELWVFDKSGNLVK